jgi:ATP-dependent RNA helicase DDX55/SPB4
LGNCRSVGPAASPPAPFRCTPGSVQRLCLRPERDEGGAGHVTARPSMATAGAWSSLDAKLDPLIISALEGLGYPAMTPCQAAGIAPIIQHQDVAVEAETGSGKTLSFLVPIAQLLLFSPNTRCPRPSPSVRALVIVPTRELAAQVHAAASALFGTLPGNVVPVPLIGGESATYGPGPAKQHAADTRVVIATPGRLNAAMNAGALSVRHLEVLIMDEADRLLDMGFSVALTSILTRLPKQRRTGLYSATQTEEVDELARAGLRNPVRVTVRVKVRVPALCAASGVRREGGGEDVAGNSSRLSQTKSRQIIPASLSCFFTVLRQEHKLHHFARLLGAHPGMKFIVYLLTCSCVDFFARLPLPELVRAAGGGGAGAGAEPARKVVALHGKMSQTKRTRALEAFATCGNALLVCTDVAARGLDIPDVDWVVQFDPPQDPDAYVHRVGRTARLGREGSSLIYLSPNEDAYAEFLAVRRCPVEPFAWPGEAEREKDVGPREESEEGEAAAAGRDVCPEASVCEHHTALLRKMILSDRAVLDVAEKGFLSYLRAYKEHRCSYLLPFSGLDIGSVARSFSLVRLPRFQEFKKHRAALNFEKDPTVRVRDISYKDKTRERKRKADIAHAIDNRKERRDALKLKSRKGKKRKAKPLGPPPGLPSRPAKADADHEDDVAELEDMNAEARMLKKVRRGKLSTKQFDAEAGYDALDGLDGGTSSNDDEGGGST